MIYVKQKNHFAGIKNNLDGILPSYFERAFGPLIYAGVSAVPSNFTNCPSFFQLPRPCPAILFPVNRVWRSLSVSSRCVRVGPHPPLRGARQSELTQIGRIWEGMAHAGELYGLSRGFGCPGIFNHRPAMFSPWGEKFQAKYFLVAQQNYLADKAIGKKENLYMKSRRYEDYSVDKVIIGDFFVVAGS
jgi:hypothetical protein